MEYDKKIEIFYSKTVKINMLKLTRLKKDRLNILFQNEKNFLLLKKLFIIYFTEYSKFTIYSMCLHVSQSTTLKQDNSYILEEKF